MQTATLTIIGAIALALLVVPASDAVPCGCSCPKALPERKCNEDDITYYKQIFHVDCSCENNVKKFYEEVFYQYKNEGQECYVKRIDLIFTSVYANLDCRYDIKWQQYLSKYYQYKYMKKSGEKDELYFERVLTKTCESETVYKSKFELLKKFVKKVDWSKVKIEVKSKKGYSIVKKTTTKSENSCGCQKKKKQEEEHKKKEAKAKKSEGSCGCQKKQEKKTQKKTQQENNGKSCGCQGNKENQKAKETKNKEKIKEEECKHSKNVGEIEKQNKEHDCRVQKAKEQDAEHDQNVKKICEQDNVHNQNVDKVKKQNEDHENNVEIVECQKTEHEKNEKEIAARKKEHNKNEQIIDAQKQEHCENVQKVEAQQAEHDSNVKCIEDSNKEHDKNVEKIDTQKKAHEENVKKWIKKNYGRKGGEDDNTYYERITCKTGITNKEFVERITIARCIYSGLDLWYAEKYLYIIKEYYTLAYTKKTTETENVYYKRLFAKESYESVSNWSKRMHLLHKIFVDNSVWYEEKYYVCFTKNFYQVYYKKEESESNEVYLKRVFAKVDGECEENYWKRIKLIEKTFPDYTCWSDKESLAKIDSCKCLSEVKTEEELKKNVESQKSDKASDECSKAKFECLQVAFKSSKSSSKTSETTTEEEQSSYKSNCND